MPKGTSSNELKLQTLKLAGDSASAALKAAKADKLSIDEHAAKWRSTFSENYDLIAEKLGPDASETLTQVLIVLNCQKPEDVLDKAREYIEHEVSSGGIIGSQPDTPSQEAA